MSSNTTISSDSALYHALTPKRKNGSGRWQGSMSDRPPRHWSLAGNSPGALYRSDRGLPKKYWKDSGYSSSTSTSVAEIDCALASMSMADLVSPSTTSEAWSLNPNDGPTAFYPQPLNSAPAQLYAADDPSTTVFQPDTLVPDNSLWLQDPTKYTLEPQSTCSSEQKDAFIYSRDVFLLPQASYDPTKSNRGFTRLQSIDFTEPIGRLVPLTQLLSAASLGTWNGEDAMRPDVHQVGQKVSLRLNWPGYPPRVKQLNIKNFKKDNGFISKATLGKRVAQTIQVMMKELQAYNYSGRYAIGPGGIQFEDVMLGFLEHRSKGSWQPQLYIRCKAAAHGP